MREDRFQVVLDGLKPDVDVEQARVRLAGLFKIEEKTLERLLGTCPCVVQKDLDQATARRAVHALDGSGARSRLEAMVSLEPAETDERLEMESSLEPPAAPQRLCPKCQHPLGPAGSTPPPMEECPACGVVVAKYLELAGGQDSHQVKEDLRFPVSQPQTTLPDTPVEDLPVAPLKQRVYAGIYTFFTIGLINGVAKIMFSLLLLWISLPMTSFDKLEPGIRILNRGIVFDLVWGLLTLTYLFLLSPLRNSSTHGQEKLGIMLLSENGEQLELRQYLLRFAGHMKTIVTFPVMLWRKSDGHAFISWGDRMSGTTQVSISPLPPRPLRTALKPLGLSLALVFLTCSLCIATMQFTKYREKARPTTQKITTPLISPQVAWPPVSPMAAEPENVPAKIENSPPKTAPQPAPRRSRSPEDRLKLARRGYPAQILGLELQYYDHFKHYTSDVFQLIATVCASCENREDLFYMAGTGKAAARLVDQDCEVGVELDPGVWHVVSSRGGGDVRKSFP
jgi:uncharacterized RDD family membrane protein YckC